MIPRFLACLCVTVVIASSAAAQSSGLRRLTDRDDLLGWEAVGRLEIGEGGFCTATLIAPDLVLTAAHCVVDGRQKTDPSLLQFRAGLRDGVAVAERGIAAIAVPRQYRRMPDGHIADVLFDVALLRLSEPITSTQADPFVLHEGAVRGREISVTSYGQDRAEALSRQERCNIVAEDRSLMAFDCQVTFGSSGAPVFVKHGDRGRILSIISRGKRRGEGVVSVGMRLPELVATLKSDLRQQAMAVPGPGMRRVRIGDRAAPAGAKFVRP